MSDERIEELGLPRRTFLKRAAAVFAAPVVASFALDGIAEAHQREEQPRQTFANQTAREEQEEPNQTFANQTAREEQEEPNQTFANQTAREEQEEPNQTFANQTVTQERNERKEPDKD
jgi:hypothetical protein